MPPVSNPLAPKLQLTPGVRDGIRGIATPGAHVEAINLSTAPSTLLLLDDTLVIARAGPDGSFQGSLDGVQEGDVLRVRARTDDGKVTDWQDFKASGLAGKDTRCPVVGLKRLSLEPVSNGKVGVFNRNGLRPFTEPGALLQLTNLRTGEKSQATATGSGGIPANLKIAGQPGDTFSVAVSDGVNNTDFQVEAGRVRVPTEAALAVHGPLRDPKLYHADYTRAGNPRFPYKHFNGPLVRNGLRPQDIFQGQLGDCFFPATVAAIVKSDPDTVERMFEDNHDGTFTVAFRKKDRSTGRYHKEYVTVDRDLPVDHSGAPAYAAGQGWDGPPDQMEMWFPLLEKAYAKWRGSYDPVGSGGYPSMVFEAVLGETPEIMDVSADKAEQVWATLQKIDAGNLPACASTHGDNLSALYINTGVYADHEYTIMGVEEKNGQRYVKLRNPWGESEPAGNGRDDGIFAMPLSDFLRLYGYIDWVKDT